VAKFRPERVGNLVREEISTLIARGFIKDPRVSTFLSISNIKFAPDLTSAKVYISSIESRGKLESGVKGLNSAAGFIQQHLGKKLKIRNVPKLVFYADESIQESFQINKIIDNLNTTEDE